MDRKVLYVEPDPEARQKFSETLEKKDTDLSLTSVDSIEEAESEVAGI